MKKKYALDLHVHTNNFSLCSRLSPDALVARAMELQLDGIVITEHGKVWSGAQIEELKESTGADSLLILSGQEIRAISDKGTEGDVLVYGIDKNLPEYLSVDELLKIVKSSGGAAVAAHPRRNILSFGEEIFDYSFDGIESLNSNYGYNDIMLSLNDMGRLDCAFTGGSDAHTVSRVGNYLTFFEQAIESIADIVSAIRNKKCRPACGIMNEREMKELLQKNNIEMFIENDNLRECTG